MLGRCFPLLLVVLGASTFACSPDSFRPAKDAYKEGEDGLADLARMAAKHGANAFLITNDNTDERVTEYGGGGGGAFSRNAVTKTNHKYVASAYRCPNAPGVSDQAAR